MFLGSGNAFLAQHGRWAFKTGKFYSFFAFSRRIYFFSGGWSLLESDFCISAAAIISLFKFIDTNYRFNDTV
jgi:hypothetical protein